MRTARYVTYAGLLLATVPAAIAISGLKGPTWRRALGWGGLAVVELMLLAWAAQTFADIGWFDVVIPG